MFAHDSLSRIVEGGVILAIASLGACTQKPSRVDLPSAPVASPTSTELPETGKSPDQPQRSASEPAIPFDGGQPENVKALPVPSDALDRKSSGIRDVYAELTGSSRSCGEGKP